MICSNLPRNRLFFCEQPHDTSTYQDWIETCLDFGHMFQTPQWERSQMRGSNCWAISSAPPDFRSCANGTMVKCERGDQLDVQCYNQNGGLFAVFLASIIKLHFWFNVSMSHVDDLMWIMIIDKKWSVWIDITGFPNIRIMHIAMVIYISLYLLVI